MKKQSPFTILQEYYSEPDTQHKSPSSRTHIREAKKLHQKKGKTLLQACLLKVFQLLLSLLRIVYIWTLIHVQSSEQACTCDKMQNAMQNPRKHFPWKSFCMSKKIKKKSNIENNHTWLAWELCYLSHLQMPPQTSGEPIRPNQETVDGAIGKPSQAGTHDARSPCRHIPHSTLPARQATHSMSSYRHCCTALSHSRLLTLRSVGFGERGLFSDNTSSTTR